MKKKKITKRIILYELIGFIIVAVLLWTNEVFDIPRYLLGAARTPINWVESIIETIFVIILGIFIIYVSWRQLNRIKYLEGFVPLCSNCKKVGIDDNKWIPFEEFIEKYSEVEIGYGLCPECAQKLFYPSCPLDRE